MAKRKPKPEDRQLGFGDALVASTAEAAPVAIPVDITPTKQVQAEQPKPAEKAPTNLNPSIYCQQHRILLVHTTAFVDSSEFGYVGRPHVQACPACMPLELVDNVSMLYRVKE